MILFLLFWLAMIQTDGNPPGTSLLVVTVLEQHTRAPLPDTRVWITRVESSDATWRFERQRCRR